MKKYLHNSIHFVSYCQFMINFKHSNAEEYSLHVAVLQNSIKLQFSIAFIFCEPMIAT